jgi:hypothetical protein
MSSNTGTIDQAQLLWDLMIKTNRQGNHTQAYTISWVMKQPMDLVGRKIDELNAELGFNRQSSPATMKQITYIRDLRVKAGLRNGTDAPTIKNTSYEEADLMIKDLKEDMAYAAQIKAFSDVVDNFYTTEAV